MAKCLHSKYQMCQSWVLKFDESVSTVRYTDTKGAIKIDKSEYFTNKEAINEVFIKISGLSFRYIHRKHIVNRQLQKKRWKDWSTCVKSY